MMRNKRRVPASRIIILLLVLGNVITIIEAYTGNEKWYWVLVLTLPLLLPAIINVRQGQSCPLKD